MRIRTVDVESEGYKCARKYMIRLFPEDFSDPNRLKRLADTAKMTPEQFKKQFEYLVQ